MDDQELQTKFQMFEQQIMQVQQQLQAIDQALADLLSLDHGLDELVGNTDKEILAQIGRGIFVKTKLISEDLTVDVGNKNFVKKSIPETKEIIREQVEKLTESKQDLEKELGKINQELTNTMLDFQKNAQSEHACGCGHEKEGGCEDDCEDGDKKECKKECGEGCKCEKD